MSKGFYRGGEEVKELVHPLREIDSYSEKEIEAYCLMHRILKSFKICGKEDILYSAWVSFIKSLPDEFKTFDKEIGAKKYYRYLWGHFMYSTPMVGAGGDDFIDFPENSLHDYFLKIADENGVIIEDEKKETPTETYQRLFKLRVDLLNDPSNAVLVRTDEVISNLLLEMYELTLKAKTKLGHDYCRRVAVYHVASGSSLLDEGDLSILEHSDFEGELKMAFRIEMLLDRIEDRLEQIKKDIDSVIVPENVSGDTAEEATAEELQALKEDEI